MNQTNAVAVYWSIQYEEQFYVLVACFLALAAKFRAPMQLLYLCVTAAALCFVALYPDACTGFFLDYWPMFTFGVFLFYRLSGKLKVVWKHAFDATIGITVVVAGAFVWINHEPGIAPPIFRPLSEEFLIASLFCGILIITYPFDSRLMRPLSVKALAFIGTFSYSLYLIHQCNLTLVETICTRLLQPSVAAVAWWPAVIGLHLGIAFFFYLAFEKPFLNSPLSAPQTAESQGSSTATR